MRADNLEFSEKNKALTQEPVYVEEISFDELNADTHFITSHAVTGLTGSISDRALKLISSSTQKLDPDKAHATIGNSKFQALDVGLTSLMRSKLNEDKGLKGKRVRFYKGHRGLNWSQFELFNTYIIDNDISYKDGLYTFNCGDIQRSMKKKIFIEQSTSIMAPVSATDDTINVLDASKFSLVYQVPSETGVTLLRGLQQKVYPAGHENAGQLVYPQLVGVDHIGLVRIPGENKDEIALFTGKSGNTLTGLIRGVLGTTAVDVEVESGITISDAPKISEYVYINMPAVKAIYALLTGSIYGAPGEFLPDHWHLNISTSYIQTSSFINIGADLWDLSDDDKGFPILIKGRKDIEAKKFIEQKIYYTLGLYAPINSHGEIQLKRTQYIGPSGSYVRKLDESNVISYSEVKYDLEEIRNAYILKWNYDDATEKYTRTSTLFDKQSRDRHKNTDVKIIELDTLHGSRHSDAMIKYHFDALRSRYSGPPIKITLTLTPDQDGLEVGDIVRLDLKAFEDHTNESGALNRNFEVQQVSIDAKTGRVKVSLFGSSQRASDVIPENPVTASDIFLTSEGTEINATNFPSSGIVSSGGVTTVNGNLTLTGHADLNNSASVFYVDEDLTIDAGAVVTINNNVQLRVNGFFQHNGLIDGAGNGLSGGVADNVASHVDAPVAANLGKKGIGNTIAQAGFVYRNTTSRAGRVDIVGSQKSFDERIVIGSDNPIDQVFLKLNESGGLEGLPSNLQGTSGSSGGGIYNGDNNTDLLSLGGDGGSGGAGLAIFSKGSALGDAAEIDLSGGEGQTGELYYYTGAVPFSSQSGNFPAAYAGAGAGGAPGSLLLCALDSTQTFFSPDQFNTVLNHAKSNELGYLQGYISFRTGSQHGYFMDGGSNNGRHPICSKIGGGAQLKASENLWEQYSNIVFLDTSAAPVIDPPPYVEPIPAFTLTEQLNTPVTPNGDRSSIEVSVTRPIFNAGEIDNYSYSLVEYRVQGDDLWIAANPASPESVIEVPSNGANYEVRIRAVSTSKNTNDTGPVQTITVTDINGRTDNDLSNIYPFDEITGLKLSGETDNTFSGGDASFEWDNSNSEYAYFNYYQIDLYSGAQLLRTEKSVSPFYVYSYEKNAIDYKRINGADGFYVDLTSYVKPVSKYFNNLSEFYSGAQESLNVLAEAISPDAITLSYEGQNAILSWPETSLKFFTITATLEYSGTIIQETSGNSFVIPVSWVGSRSFNIKFSHLPGYTTSPVVVVVNPNAPTTPAVSARVISNSVTLNYTSAKGSLPIDRYEIRRGATYDAGQVPDIKSGSSSFTVYDEISAGTVIYWFVAVDTAGNKSGHVSVSAIVSQPQNYQLLAQYSAKSNSWPGTMTNCFVTQDDNLLLPVNVTETWGEHFTNNSFNTPQDQINAGYEYYLQPSTATAQYQFTYDYSSLIDSATITANSAPIILDGSVTVAVHIEFSDDNISWTSGGSGQTQIIATNFRYIRVTLDFASVGGDDLAYVEDVLISIDKRVDDDSGKFAAVSTDTNGTRVYFNKDFIDAQTPTVNVSSTEIVDVVVDFNDIPDPEYFDVYVFSRATGLRINANCSWTVRGFTRIGA